ncbi:glycoside hydrolase family 3 C-terminal domain-containing protein [Actinospica sp. MGRD01-02]|uniref:Glycoside hydrolase family 3 C-terminal domain-containing protein n=1 Tax=Actinospica acidithermotolerans TaxID=2828514 RepID=A0A941E9V7_9ACTN|nr:glycoside hydrolase family 3 C-terminal domain-containing protein [Actinospica acidithermotolerans]MBR7825204.1 glycoside hydrolase family 3 C-terminal domain-containing protein [Actinospica acidithermotolerans]
MTPAPEDQAAALLAELTVAEKIAFLHQHQPAVDRLGLAKFHTGCEALHGVAWIGKATVYPQAVGLGATWDRDLLRRVGAAVSTEVRAFKQDTANAFQLSAQTEKFPMVSLNVWAPVVNPLRDPRWGRNEEGYSEDAYATSELATAYCTGLRGEHPTVWRTTPVLKHFLAYNTETDRDLVDIQVPERVLREYELEAFRGPIEAGVAAGVMPGYNLTNGVPNHVHPLINDVLHAWDPELAICSDAQAPSNLVDREKFFATHAESHAAALKAGVDSYTDNSADSQPTIERFTEALDRGLITEADVDAAVRRVLLMRARSGEFAPEDDPYAGIRADVIDCAQHRELSREAALASVVLLKNEGGALPLAEPGRVAVIGHLGSRVMTDWYSGTLPYEVSVADGLRAEFPSAAVDVADGADLVVLRDAGGIGEFGPFRHQDWGTSVQCPIPVHTLQSVDNGRYLTLTGEGDTEIEAAAATPDGWFVKELWEFETVSGNAAADLAHGELLLRSNAPHSRKYARVERATGRLVADAETPEQATRFRLETVASGLREAAELAAAADRVVLVLGNDPHINGRETVDRDSLALPPGQERLLHAVVAANPGTVLVVVSSYPYAIDWAAENVPAIVWSSHAGQELGTAIAQVLSGRHNPSGRLPQTWYSGDAELPGREDYDVIGSGWTYRYSRRAHVYPFGHGLTYATFDYSTPAVAVREILPGSLTLSAEVSVANTSGTAGHEVVQLYVRREGGEARRALVGFDRIRLEPGESRRIAFDVPRERFAQWSPERSERFLPPGEYVFEFARSSEDAAAVARVELS